MPRRTTYHHGDLRQALLRAAVAIIDREGVEACTIRACARRAGVSHAAPLHHFPDRQALLVAVTQATWLELGTALDTAAQAGGDRPESRLLAIGLGYIDWAAAHPARFRLACALVVNCVKPLGEEPHPAWVVLQREMLPYLARASLDLDLERLGARMLLAWAAVHGLATLRIDGVMAAAMDDPQVTARLVTQALTLLGDAFVSRRDDPTPASNKKPL